MLKISFVIFDYGLKQLIENIRIKKRKRFWSSISNCFESAQRTKFLTELLVLLICIIYVQAVDILIINIDCRT